MAMKKNLLLFFFLYLFVIPTHAQQKPKPKLVVGIVVDQMRTEYLYRFYDQFGKNGFKRLMRDGFNCRNVHFNYIPTYTGPGHASIWSGTTPAYHGIVGNDWYDRSTKKIINCVSDSTEQVVGIKLNNKGVSARKLLSTNLADELKLATNQHAVVLAISLKDRAAVLPAGHMANAAYWFNVDSGSFVSSTFFMKNLPDWALNFNKDNKKYLQNPWKQALPGASYVGSENLKPDFNYPIDNFAKVYSSIYGNTIVTDFAIEALQKERLGTGTNTDLLAISFSSPDAVGHQYGPLSRETNDLYLRLDQDLARILDALDLAVGAGNYLLFLTGDHGVAEVPQFLTDHGVPAGYLNTAGLKADAIAFLNKKLGEGKWIELEINEQYYLNRVLIEEKGLKLEDIQDLLADFLRKQKGVFQVYTATQMMEQNYTQILSSKLQSGFLYKRSGDVLYTMEPGWIEQMSAGSTHGSGYAYDTQVPLLWFGNGIPKGESYELYEITDIVPTIALKLGIKLPNATTGKGIGVLLNP